LKREAVDYLVDEEQLSNRKACKLIGISRTTCQYQAKPKDDKEVQDALTALTTKHAAIGYWSRLSGIIVFGIKGIAGIIKGFTGFIQR